MLNMAVRWAQSKTIGHSWGLGWFGMGLKEGFGQVTKPFQLGCVRNLRPSHLGYMKDSSTGQGEQESRRARGRRKRGPTSICPVPDVSPALSLCAPAALAFPKHDRLVCTSGPLYLLFPLPVRFFAELAPSHFSSVCSIVTSEKPEYNSWGCLLTLLHSFSRPVMRVYIYLLLWCLSGSHTRM